MDWKDGLTAAVVVGLGYWGIKSITKDDEDLPDAVCIHCGSIEIAMGGGLCIDCGRHPFNYGRAITAKEDDGYSDNSNTVFDAESFSAEPKCDHSNLMGDVSEVLSWAEYRCLDCGATQYHEFPEMNYENVEALELIDTDHRIRSDFYARLERDYPIPDDWEAESFSAEPCEHDWEYVRSYGTSFWSGYADEAVEVEVGMAEYRCKNCRRTKEVEIKEDYDAESFSADMTQEEINSRLPENICRCCYENMWTMDGYDFMCVNCEEQGTCENCSCEKCNVKLEDCKCDTKQCSVCGDLAVHVLKNGEIVLCDKHYQQQFGRYSERENYRDYPGKYSAESFSADDKKVKQALKRVGPLANEVRDIGKTLRDSLEAEESIVKETTIECCEGEGVNMRVTTYETPTGLEDVITASCRLCGERCW